PPPPPTLSPSTTLFRSAAAPVALALFVYWPLRIAVYGGDLFRSGGPDADGAGEVFAWAFYIFPIWAVALLLIGVRTVHGWSWGRSEEHTSELQSLRHLV